jgi:hypothetical protein
MRHEEYMLKRAEEEDHPVLIVPNDAGCLLVIGTRQAQKDLTPKQMVHLASLLLQRATVRMDNK